METDVRTVFDTNAMVSALLFEQSVPANAFFAAWELGDILLSQDTFRDLSEVLGRSQFDGYVTREEREQFPARLLIEGTMVEIGDTVRACRDPKDDKLLELADSGAASCLVTGDQDLLVLNPFRGITILTPAQFLAMFPQANLNET
jgi:putative PIN family toxin of toxin-antitoxin system